MMVRKLIAGLLMAVTIISTAAGVSVPADAAAKTGKVKVEKTNSKKIVMGKLSASNDMKAGKNTDVTFYFHPQAASGSAIELQDPKKTYSLYEYNPDLLFAPKNIRKTLLKHHKKYNKIATLKYYDAGEKVKGMYVYKADVTLKRPWIPISKKWYKYVVMDDKTGRPISNTVKLTALKDLESCGCNDCCCKNCCCKNCSHISK